VRYCVALKEVLDSGVVCRDVQSGEEFTLECDSVLLAMGMRPRWELVDSLRRSAPETSVHIVGDCKKAATISDAVNGAFQACIHI